MKSTFRLLLLISVLTCFTFSAKAQNSQASLEEVISSPEFWSLSQDTFMERYAKLGFRWTSDYQEMCDLSEDYNRIAKRGKDKSKMVKTGSNVNNWYNFDYFDPDILKATRLKSSSGIKKFEAEVKRSIDAGIPLLWTVTVGIYKEPVRISQNRGGHMRMIIGYNTTKKEIIFSDTWGAGHEKKSWGIEEAYCSTKGLYSIQPTM